MNGFQVWSSQLNGDLWRSIPQVWQDGLADCRFDIERIEALLSDAQQRGISYVPGFEQIFAALKVHPEEVSVILLGQDPYPSPDQAIGLAFAVPANTSPVPGSLRNIFKEIESDLGTKSTADLTLASWVDQGVLLLNTSLTTEEGLRAAHSAWPWEAIVRSVINRVVELNPNVVALLWGNYAKAFGDLFNPDSVVESAHPSPLSAYRGFLGSKPFSRANQILQAAGKTPIQW